MKYFIYITSFFGILHSVVGQYPNYYIYDNENGLYAADVYNIVEDRNGFIWIGSDEGLYKFDGIRFISYKCQSQNSRPVSNLSVSSNGIIFCINFHDQIFYLENDTLKELKHSLKNISNISIDKKNNYLYVNHSKGISIYDIYKKFWKNINGISEFTRSVLISDNNDVYFLKNNGVAMIRNNSLSEICNEVEGASSHYLMIYFQNKIFLFKRDESLIYTIINNHKVKFFNKKLYQALKNKKITNIKVIDKNVLWVTTYSGIISYDFQKDSVSLFYPDFSFSDIYMDSEGNYWLASLQSGLLFVPDLKLLVWDHHNKLIKNSKLSHLATDSQFIYFSTVNGQIGKLNIKSNELKMFMNPMHADIECMTYDVSDKSLIFNSNNHTYKVQNDKIKSIKLQTSAIKSLLYFPSMYVLGTSMGLYVEYNYERKQLNKDWIRQLIKDKGNKILAATNKGIQVFEVNNNNIFKQDILHEHSQILSIDYDAQEQKIYAVSYNGKIYKNKKLITRISNTIHPNKIKYHQKKIFVATNRGLYKYDIVINKWDSLNKSSGLISDNIQDILVLDDNLWLATGKGLQKIPLINTLPKSKTTVYLKNIKNNFILNYDEPIILYPEARSYSSLGNFIYAYRVNQQEWITLPSNIEKIEIQNLPSGNNKIELKVIDHLSRDSNNIIVLNAYVKMPFWRSVWAILIVFIIIFLFIVFIYKKRIKKLRQYQQIEIHRINLENNLRLTQHTALKSQMNPHFIFNVLSSIKSYIYQNDKKNAVHYLDRFSDLIRKILEQSTLSKIKLKEEIETLKLYIDLESMLLDDDFEYHLSVDKNIDQEHIFIPALIIQPLVENAFKHGLRHQKNKKQLSIMFSLNNDILTVIIEDNGIGRNASEKINQQFAHKSFASDALMKRIHLLNISQKNTITMQIIDMEDEAHNPSGTKVIIYIKIDSSYE